MYTLNFDRIHKEDVAIAGGKGANLGEMTTAGIPVPAGFVLTSEAYRHFIRHNNYTEDFASLLKEAGTEEAKLCAAAQKLRTLILNGQFPQDLVQDVTENYMALSGSEDFAAHDARVAVRSSATAEDLPDASFAGQQETYLNVCGINEVLNHIKKCYASLWGDRAVCYRLNQGYDQLSVALAVVIQEMVESEKAGVLFTVNPVTQDSSQMQINANYGLGESVVSGRVTADSILCGKDGSIINYEIGSKKTQIVYDEKNTRELDVDIAAQDIRCLSDAEIKDLCQAGRCIEEHYGHPMDIEWAIRQGKTYILQARAITTLSKKTADPEETALIASYLKGSKISGPLKENMAFQLEKMPYAYRPLDYDLMVQINTQKAKIFHEGGIAITSDPKIDDDGIMTLPDPRKGITRNIVKLPGLIKKIKDYGYCAEQCRKFMPRYEKQIAELQKVDFDRMSPKDCGRFLSYAYNLLGELCYDRFKYALFPSALGGKLTKAVQRIDKKYTNYDLYRGLDNKTAVITREVAALAETLKKNIPLSNAILSGTRYAELTKTFPECTAYFSAFLSRNGFKSDFNCYCIEAKTLYEDPDRLLNILRPLLSTNTQAENTGSAKEPVKEYEEMLQKLSVLYGGKYPALKEDIEHFRLFHIVREESQYLWETLFFYIRKCLARINQIFLGGANHTEGISNLFYQELLDACERGSLNDADLEKIKRRNEKHPLSQKVWDASKLLVFDTNGEVLKGVSGSSGTAVGTVCIVHSPAEFYKMKKGDILVCELTDPEWTPLFALASAVVADTGSSLSHAAIVAREFGIPAVLGVGFATSKFKDGDTIRVDGDKGMVSAC
ncbi:MAG: phosphoenolpyruvate synthase [Lachnospiraceae bacterium]|nr:phosphoenolpyruvate synthase [Lachnospiraceae bacterium]